MPTGYPLVGGHEGASTVLKVGSGVTDFSEGDRVAFTFRPSCGRCRYCASDRANLCVNVERIQPGEVAPRFSKDGQPYRTQSFLATFATHSVVFAAPASASLKM